jgi:hypothetical protein
MARPRMSNGLNVWLGQQGVRVCAIHPDEQSSPAARARRKVSVDEEGHTAEHALLGDTGFGSHDLPHAGRKPFVVRHDGSIASVRPLVEVGRMRH